MLVKKSVIIIYYIAAIAMAAATFIHMFFPADLPQVIKATEAHQKVKDIRNEYRDALFQLNEAYNNGTVTVEEFNRQLPQRLNDYRKYEAEAERLFAALNTTIEDNKIFGFPSWRKFLAAFGSPFVIFSLAVFLFLAAFSESQKLLRKAKLWLTFTACVIACYSFTWIFVDLPDLPFWSYIMVMLVCGVLASLAMRYLTQWFYFRKISLERPRRMVRILTNLIVATHESMQRLNDDIKEDLKKQIEASKIEVAKLKRHLRR